MTILYLRVVDIQSVRKLAPKRSFHVHCMFKAIFRELSSATVKAVTVKMPRARQLTTGERRVILNMLEAGEGILIYSVPAHDGLKY